MRQFADFTLCRVGVHHFERERERELRPSYAACLSSRATWSIISNTTPTNNNIVIKASLLSTTMSIALLLEAANYLERAQEVGLADAAAAADGACPAADSPNTTGEEDAPNISLDTPEAGATGKSGRSQRTPDATGSTPAAGTSRKRGGGASKRQSSRPTSRGHEQLNSETASTSSASSGTSSGDAMPTGDGNTIGYSKLTHNEVERQRRAFLRDCFDKLRSALRLDTEEGKKLPMGELLKISVEEVRQLEEEQQQLRSSQAESALKLQSLRKRLDSLLHGGGGGPAVVGSSDSDSRGFAVAPPPAAALSLAPVSNLLSAGAFPHGVATTTSTLATASALLHLRQLPQPPTFAAPLTIIHTPVNMEALSQQHNFSNTTTAIGQTPLISVASASALKRSRSDSTSSTLTAPAVEPLRQRLREFDQQ